MCIPLRTAIPVVGALALGGFGVAALGAFGAAGAAGAAAGGVTASVAAATEVAGGLTALQSLSLAIPSLTTGQSFMASLLMSGVQNLFSTISGQNNATAQQNFQNNRAEATRLAANAAFIAEADAENLRLQQEAIASTGEAFKATIQRAKAVSTARTASGEAGVAGLSIDALYRDFNASESRFREGLKENIVLSREQTKNRLKGGAAQAASRINAARSQPVPRPSFLGAALRIGKDGFDSFQKLTTAADGSRRPLNF